MDQFTIREDHQRMLWIVHAKTGDSVHPNNPFPQRFRLYVELKTFELNDTANAKFYREREQAQGIIAAAGEVC